MIVPAVHESRFQNGVVKLTVPYQLLCFPFRLVIFGEAARTSFQIAHVNNLLDARFSGCMNNMHGGVDMGSVKLASLAFMKNACQMGNHVTAVESLKEFLVIGERKGGEGRVGQTPDRFIALVQSARQKARKVPSGHELPSQVSTDETGSSCDRDVHKGISNRRPGIESGVLRY